MDFWPSAAFASKKRTGKEKRRKGSSKEIWPTYPSISHGSQSAATLIKVGDRLEWRSLYSIHKDSLIARGEPCKIYPCTKPKDISNHDIPLKQRAQQGAKFLRTYHPDIDIPFDLIKDELEYNDKFNYSRANLDSFMGNIVSATYCNEGIKKRAIALAFPTGVLNRDLNISPVNIRPNSVIFQPRTQPLWTFDTPIFQITTSAPAVNMEEKKSYYIAVRTFGLISLFDVQNRMTSVADSRKSPFAISELMSVRSSTDKLDGRVIDMNFSASQPSDLFLVTDQGVGYRSSFKSGHKHIQKIFNGSSWGNSAFWRITEDQTAYGGTVVSEKAVRKFDTRSSSTTIDLFSYDEGFNVITSVCPTQMEHLLCVSTTSQVIWIDNRFSRRSLLGWKHYRAFDRSLSLQSVEFGDASLALLSSSKNDHISAISVGRLQDGPLQCRMPSQALSSTSGSATGRTIIRHPGVSSDSFSLIELSMQGSLHCQEFRYAINTATVSPEQANSEKCFDYVWFDDIHELEKQSKGLEPNYGELAARELSFDDLTGIYQALFGEAIQTSPAKNLSEEKAGTIDVYEALEKMPFFWQRSDLEVEHLRTLFDVAFDSGDEPLREARADFLTGTIFNSSRGYRLRKQDRFPIAEIANKAAWHMNIQKIIHRISPDTFKETPVAANQLDPYHVDREKEIPNADRRETEAREQLALDLAFSADVFSSMVIKNPGKKGTSIMPSETPPEEATLLTEAAEKLSLSSSKKEPPQVNFGIHRPVIKHGQKHYMAASQSMEGQTGEGGEGEAAAKMPLGVRLLLAEWDVGDDPYDFEYVDVYDLDGSGAQAQLAKSRSQLQRQKPTKEMVVGSLRPTQSQAPPTIVSARSLTATQVKPTIAKSSQIGFGHRSKLREETQTQTQRQYGASQVEAEPSSSQPMMIANTQIVPGPFGGRKVIAKKKQIKKRLQGF